METIKSSSGSDSLKLAKGASVEDLFTSGAPVSSWINQLYDEETDKMEIEVHPLVASYVSKTQSGEVIPSDKARKRALLMVMEHKFYKMEVGSTLNLREKDKDGNLSAKFMRLSKSRKEIEYGDYLGGSKRFRSTVISQRSKFQIQFVLVEESLY